MIGFIGGGNMAEAILAGLGSKAQDIAVSDIRIERLDYLKQNYKVRTFTNNKTLAQNCDTVVLAVKPQQLDSVLQELTTEIKDKLIISIVAGASLEFLVKKLGHARVIRVMPNTAALVRSAISVLSPGSDVSNRDIEVAKELFEAVGHVIILKEQLMDTVTALSGSGPAFVAYFIHALIEAGIREGLTAEEARTLTLHTISGTVKLIESGKAPFEVIQMVSSPAGTTVEGLYVLDKSGFKAAIKEAIRAAKERSKQLRRQ